jgi:hypothetical protein
MDFVQELLTNRNDIVYSLVRISIYCLMKIFNGVPPSKNDTLQPRQKTAKQTDGLFNGNNIMDSIMDRDTRHNKLLSLANQHKELDKAKPTAMEYPHVYGTPTGGNILNAFGKKYALPLGTERHQEDVAPHLIKLRIVLRGNHCAAGSTGCELQGNSSRSNRGA